jgi:hypothetical protein
MYEYYVPPIDSTTITMSCTEVVEKLKRDITSCDVSAAGELLRFCDFADRVHYRARSEEFSHSEISYFNVSLWFLI